MIALSGSLCAQQPTFVRADCNNDTVVGIGDAITTLNYLFAGGVVTCEDACDANDDGGVEIADPIFLLNYLFASGPAPSAPFPTCGGDPTADGVGCVAAATCPLAHPPTITSTPALVATEGVPYSYAVTVDDLDVGDSWTYALTVSPVGMAIDGGSGLLTWTPAFDQAGLHAVTVTATDSFGFVATQSFSVDVANVNLPPTADDDAFLVGPGCTLDAVPGVLGNDFDPDGDPLVAMLIDDVTNGSLTLEPDGTFQYTHDGSPAVSDSFTYEASDGSATSGVTTVTFEVTDTPFGFVDHFDTLALDSRWVAASFSGGSVTPLDGSLRVDSPGPSATGFIRPTSPLDRTVSQRWTFSVRRIGGDNLPDLVGLWRLPAGTEPMSDVAATIADQRVASIGMVNDGEPSLRFRYQSTPSGPGSFWNGDPANEWTAIGTTASALSPIREGSDADFWLFGIDLDGPGERFRFFAQHGVGISLAHSRQGLRLTALTDWVEWSDVGDFAETDQLWLTIGDRYLSDFAGSYDVDWVRLEQGDVTHGITNARTDLTSEYVLRHHEALGTQFLPDGRGNNALIGGAPGSWNDNGNRKTCLFRDDDGTHYLFYEGFDQNDKSSIGLATSPTADGIWIPHAGNPVVPQSVLPFLGVGYDVLTAPWVIKDVSEPDAQKRWKMLLCGELFFTSVHRIFLLSAPAPEGPWTQESGPGVDGSLIAESAAGDWKDDGVCDPAVWYDEELAVWCMYYSGIREKDTEFGPGGWSIGFATSPDLINWTEASDNPRLGGNPAALRAWTGFSGNSITVSDASGFRPGAAVVIRNAQTTDGWAISRIREIQGNDLVLAQRVEGLTGLSANRSVAQIDAGSLSPMALVREPHGCYRLYVTAFQPFILGALSAGFGNCELVASFTATSPQGPWTWDDFSSPHVPFDIWGAERSQENLRFVLEPTVR